jgi:DNA-dependent protein kinase catalytic subunit
MYTNLIDFSSSDYSGSNDLVEWGNLRINFARNIKSKFEEEFGKNGSLILNLSEDYIKQKLDKLNKHVDEYSGKHVKDSNIGEYSPWLKMFKRNMAKDIEIPGQYTGKSKPLLDYHIKIESFDERVSVMSSIRKPKCIIIRGDDQKEHKFLVKGGEDQRQDQRIETLFEMINNLLKSDSKCYQRNLSIKTYKVIPMTSKMALIEWIPETRTLKDAIYGARNEDELKRWESEKYNPDMMYHTFIMNASKDSKTNMDLFGHAFANPSYKSNFVSETFKGIENLVPWDLLRRFVRSMSSSSESYFVLRNQFIVSYAVASICQYILGIGDRHLSNWLIDTKNGQAIGIDFGMAFGHAVRNQKLLFKNYFD